MRKYYIRTLRLLGLAVLLLALSGVAEAGVTLVPRVNSRGDILKDERGATIAGEDYVLFGKFKHRLEKPRGDQEADATPILWRAMSLDISPTPTKATLLSHHLLEAMARQHEVTSDGSGNDPSWYRSPDQPRISTRTSGTVRRFRSG